MKPVVIIVIAVVCSVAAVLGVLVVLDQVATMQAQQAYDEQESREVAESQTRMQDESALEEWESGDSINFRITSIVDTEAKNIVRDPLITEAEFMVAEFQRLDEIICITSTKLTTDTDCVPIIEKKIEQFSRWEEMNLNQMKTEYQNCIVEDERGLSNYQCDMEANDMAVVHCGFMTSQNLVQLLESERVEPNSDAHTQAIVDTIVKDMFEQKTPCKQKAIDVIFD